MEQCLTHSKYTINVGNNGVEDNGLGRTMDWEGEDEGRNNRKRREGGGERRDEKKRGGRPSG